jgi:hypothetical protein
VDVLKSLGGKECQEHRVLDAMVKEQFYVLHVMALARNPSQILPVKNVAALVTAAVMFAVARAKSNAASHSQSSPLPIIL